MFDKTVILGLPQNLPNWSSNKKILADVCPNLAKCLPVIITELPPGILAEHLSGLQVKNKARGCDLILNVTSVSRNSWFTCTCIIFISSTQSELSKLKENLINSSPLSWTYYLQMASSVLFKFSCTFPELFTITVISFSSQIMYLGRKKRFMSWSEVHIISKLPQ